jgi:8-oxo-dGTP pyrophosphatase MutT (NUDIX family)
MANQRSMGRDWTKRYRLAAGVYAMRGGQILMLQRASGMRIGFRSVPGGIVDPGESPPEAAARELFEEAGLTPMGPLWLVTACRYRVRDGPAQSPIRLSVRCGRRAAQP